MRFSSITFIVALILLSPVAPAGQPTARKAQANSPASVPDLSGVWLGDGNGNNRGLLYQAAPMLPWVKAKFNAAGDTSDPDPFLQECAPLGVPRILLTNTPMKIVQAPNEIVLLYERNHDFREVYMDGREHPKDLDPSWWGHSIGKWDGDTLVIDTVGFNDSTWLDWSGLRHSPDLHVIERYRRIDHNTMRLDLTIDDAKAYSKTWSVKRMFTLKPWDIGEDICTPSEQKHFEEGISTPATTRK